MDMIPDYIQKCVMEIGMPKNDGEQMWRLIENDVVVGAADGFYVLVHKGEVASSCLQRSII